jgi:hypothetical protein
MGGSWRATRTARSEETRRDCQEWKVGEPCDPIKGRSAVSLAPAMTTAAPADGSAQPPRLHHGATISPSPTARDGCRALPERTGEQRHRHRKTDRQRHRDEQHHRDEDRDGGERCARDEVQ